MSAEQIIPNLKFPPSSKLSRNPTLERPRGPYAMSEKIAKYTRFKEFAEVKSRQ
jgi:hypothetical protein